MCLWFKQVDGGAHINSYFNKTRNCSVCWLISQSFNGLNGRQIVFIYLSIVDLTKYLQDFKRLNVSIANIHIKHLLWHWPYLMHSIVKLISTPFKCLVILRNLCSKMGIWNWTLHIRIGYKWMKIFWFKPDFASIAECKISRAMTNHEILK